MRVQRIRLKNVCRHEELDWKLEPGVIGLVGPNGAGKSTALNAAYAALTNDYSRFAGGKKGAIRQQAAENAKSFIEVEVEHLGQCYRITRGLRPDKHRFEILDSEQEPLTKATEISVAVEEHLGITRPLLDNYVFVAQWDMFAFLSLTEAERAKHFARLCGTTGAETRWEQLKKQVELDRGLAVKVVDTSDDIKRELSASSVRRSKLKESLERVKGRLLAATAVTSLQEVGPKRQRFLRAQEKLPQVKQAEEELLAAARKATTAVRGKEEALRESQTSLRNAQDDVDAQAEELAELRLSIKNFRNRQRLSQELLEIEKKAKEEPTRPEGLTGLTAGELEVQAADADTALADAEDLIVQCGGAGVVECPTCGTSTAAGSLQEKLREAKEQLPALRKADEAANNLLNQLTSYKRESRVYEVWKAGYDSNTRRIKLQLRDMPKIDREQTKQRINALTVTGDQRDDCRRVVDDITDALPELRVDKQDAITSHVEAKQKRNRIEVTLETDKTTEEEDRRADEQLYRHELAVKKAAELQATIREIERGRRSAKKRLEEMRAAIKQSVKGRKWVAFLESARAVLHRDQLPAEVHKAVLSEMEKGINEDLDDLDSPFYVRSNEKLSFTAFFQDGVVMSAGGLSGGEKVTLALPFRLQVNSMFASQVGMLVLDEPTAGLDADHVESVIEVFDQLRGVAKARGFQIIVITHETGLERAFDQVFNVGNLE